MRRKSGINKSGFSLHHDHFCFLFPHQAPGDPFSPSLPPSLPPSRLCPSFVFTGVSATNQAHQARSADEAKTGLPSSHVLALWGWVPVPVQFTEVNEIKEREGYPQIP